jgi:acyl CoA:acetate/3-ketoacid CoA transferase alpha subunit
LNKIYKTIDDAISDIFGGAIVTVSGFGYFGELPVHLIVSLAKQGVNQLTVIANSGGVGLEFSLRIKPNGY